MGPKLQIVSPLEASTANTCAVPEPIYKTPFTIVGEEKNTPPKSGLDHKTEPVEASSAYKVQQNYLYTQLHLQLLVLYCTIASPVSQRIFPVVASTARIL